MTREWDANIRSLYAVDDGSWLTIDFVANGDPFDVIVTVEIGEALNETVDDYLVRVAVRNLTQSTTLAISDVRGTMSPAQNAPLTDEIRVDFDGKWSAGAAVGDVLQAVASYRVNAGANVLFSTAESNIFVVS
jgi:hypothetical protein